MDLETRNAIQTVWKYGINPIKRQMSGLEKEIKDDVADLRKEMTERFDKLDSLRRWRITQLLTTIGFAIAIIIAIIQTR